MDDQVSYAMTRIKRHWVPEWLFAMLAPLSNRWPWFMRGFKKVFTRDLCRIEQRRYNGV